VIIAPQCPRGKLWHALTTELLEFIDIMSQRYALDKQRGYCTGLSMGGFGCWTLATAAPGCFAALAPICGGYCRYDERCTTGKVMSLAQMQRLADGQLDVSTVRHIPTWLFHGQKDNIVLVRGPRRGSSHQGNSSVHALQRQRTFVLARSLCNAGFKEMVSALPGTKAGQEG